MAKQRGTRGGQGNTVTLHHPIAGEKTLSETQYKILKAAADNSETRSANLKKIVGYATGTIDNAFTKIFSEFEVSSRIAAIIWFSEAEVVSEDTGLVDADSEKPVPVADEQDNLLADVRGWQQRFTYTLSAGSAFGGFIIFGYIIFFHARRTTMNDWSNVYSFVPLIGGGMGAWIARRARKITRAYYYLPIMIICFGIIYWSIGGLIWLYLNIKGIEQPYPSVPDVGYAPAAIAIILGCFLLHIRTTREHLPQLLGIVVIVIIGFGFGLFLLMWFLRGEMFIAGKDPWKMVLDVGYPLADIISLVLLLLTQMTGGQEISRHGLNTMLRWLAVGMVLYFIADISFSITTTLPEDNPWYYAPGTFPDLIFMIAFWVLSLTAIRMPIQNTYEAS